MSAINEFISAEVKNNNVVLFMKGTPDNLVYEGHP